MCPWARHFICCLVLVQPRKTRPDMHWDIKNNIKNIIMNNICSRGISVPQTHLVIVCNQTLSWGVQWLSGRELNSLII